MSRYIRILRQIALLMICTAVILTSCASQKTPESPREDISGTLNITATCYPVFALAAMITDGIDDVNLSCLTQPRDACLRTYVLSDWDAAISASSDVIIIGGSGLESYADAFFSMGENGPAVVTAIYDQEMRQHECLNKEKADTSHWSEPNPHVYMSLSGAEKMLVSIEAGMSVIDPDHAENYIANYNSAIDRIEELRQTAETLNQELAGTKVIIMSESLVYTADELGFEIEACLARENGDPLYGSALQDCIERLSLLESRIVMIEQQAPALLVRSFENAGFTVLKMDTMSTISPSAGADGYFDAFNRNYSQISEKLKK